MTDQTTPRKPPSDAAFLAAMEGYARCLNESQDARLTREQLERLILLAKAKGQ